MPLAKITYSRLAKNWNGYLRNTVAKTSGFFVLLYKIVHNLVAVSKYKLFAQFKLLTDTVTYRR